MRVLPRSYFKTYLIQCDVFQLISLKSLKFGQELAFNYGARGLGR